MKDFLEKVIRDCVTYTEYRKAKTVTALDVRSPFHLPKYQANHVQVIHALKRLGRPIYGFDPEGAKGKNPARK